MHELPIRQLRAECRPILNKFYRELRSHMRAPPGANYWVAGDTPTIGGLCLTKVADGQWLTGLLVAPAYRNRGLATRLVVKAVSTCRCPVWLFCEQDLVPFYERLGFNLSLQLPEPLDSKLERYNRHKVLRAMHYLRDDRCLTGF